MMLRGLLTILVYIAVVFGIFVFPANAQAQTFSDNCILERGVAYGSTLAEATFAEVTAAEEACEFIENDSTPFLAVAGVKSLKSVRIHIQKNVDRCAAPSDRGYSLSYCGKIYKSSWTVKCCPSVLGSGL